MNLVEIEAIKQLKARYFRYMDTKQWEKWGMVWAEDAELHNPASRPHPVCGRRAIVDMVSRRLENMMTVHHGHMPEIQLTGEREAVGIWAMYDKLLGVDPLGGGSELRGYGHYIEQYRKEEDDQWRIRRLELRRLMVTETEVKRSTDPSVFFS